MKTLKFSHLILAILFCLGMMKLTSCSKEEVTGGTSNEVYVGGDSDNNIQFGDGDGCMTVVVAHYSFGSINQTVTTGVAYFPSVPGGNDYVNVGTVTMNGYPLTPDSNNLYSFQLLSELNFSDGINWTVQGGSGIAGFSHSYNEAPTSYTVDVPSSASLSTDITVSAQGLSNADSVHFALISPNEFIWTMQGGSWTSFTFTPSQLAHLTTGEGMGVITSFRFNSAVMSGKKFYFANERSIGSSVTFTN